MAQPERRYWMPGLLVIFLVALFYVHGIHNTYMISDEYLVYRFTRGTLAESVGYLANRDVHPPLWFSLFWFWQRLAGDSDFAGRMQAILFSLLTLSIVYQLGRRWFGSAHFGLFAIPVLGASALFFRYSLEIRPYALAMLLASLSMLAFQHWLRRRTWRAAGFYAVTIAALLYVHYFLFMLVLVQAIFFVFTRPSRQLLRQSGGVALLAFALWLPWFSSFLSQLERIRAVELASGAARGLAGSSVTTQPTSIEAIRQLVELAANGQVLLYAALALLGILFWWRNGNFRLALAWALGLPLVAFALNTVVAVYNPRYIVNFIVGLALVLSAALGVSARRLRWGMLAVFVGLSLLTLPSQLPDDIVPYRNLFRDLMAAARPGDTLLFDQGGWGGDVMLWQWQHISTPEIREGGTDDLETALVARRIWHITGDWFNDDVRANFSRIEQTHPLQSVLGKCDSRWCYLIQLLESPPWESPQVFGEALGFWGADIDSVTPDAIHARLWWKAEQTPAQDYSIGLHLLSPQGSLVAQADGAINHYDEQLVNTSALEPGRIYVDFRSLPLSPDLPPGDYRLEVVVYHWQTGERLTVNGVDHLYLQSIKIP